MPLGTFAPGPYTMTYNALPVGLVRDNGKLLRWRFMGKEMTADLYGMTVIDRIYAGARVFLGPIYFKEWNANVRAMIWPHSATPGALGQLGVPGTLASNKAKVITLTPVANTPAATAGPTLITANLAFPADENDVEMLMGCDERDVPVLFELLPYDSGGGTIVFFTVTQP